MKSHLVHRFAAALGLAASLGVSLFAQSTPTYPAKSDSTTDTVKLATFVVTGSNIPIAADKAAVPVVVLGQAALEQTGLSANALEILRKDIPAFAGRSNAGNSNATNTNQNTAGGSQIALRNLDTLVLINGRRVATSGINGVGGKSFVDVNQIPTAAIERVEVLTDGASAIYGSDAIGGVVNFILKSNYQGAEVGSRYAVSTNDGHYSERSAYLLVGAKTDNLSATFTASWAKTDPLWQSQRPFIRSNLKSGTNFPGFVSGAHLNPSLNSPAAKNPTGSAATAASMAALVANGTYLAAGDPSIPLLNAAPYETMLLRQEQRSAVLNLTGDIVPKRLSVFGDYLWSGTKGFNQTSGFLGNLRTVTVPAGSPYNPTTGALAGVVMGTVNTPMQTTNDGRGNRVTVGARGDIVRDWKWEAGYTYSDNRLDQHLVNEVYAPNVASAIAGGFDASGNAAAGGKFSKVTSLATGSSVVQPALDPFARAGLDPAALANIYGTELIKVASKLDSYDAKVVGSIWELPAGKVGVAGGVAARKETLIGTPDQNSYNLSTDPTKHNWAPGTFFDPFKKSRTINAEFAEARVPIAGEKWTPPGVHALEVTLAGRTERYSDAGKSSVPKIGLRWQPVDEQFTVRFTYSKSFTAPTLYSEYGPPSVALTTADLFFNNLGINDPKLRGVTYFSGNGNNPALQPSRAWSRSIGFGLSPKGIKGLSVSLDYANIFQRGLPAGIGASAIVRSVNDLGSASPYFSAIAVGNMYGQPGGSQAKLATPGGLYNYVVGGSYGNDIYITDHFINSGGVHVRALDFNVAYELPTTSVGRFTVTTTGTYFNSFQVQDLPTLPFYEYAGYATNGKTMSGTLPRYSVYTTVAWRHHGWDALVADTYIPSMPDIANGQVPALYLASNPETDLSYYTTVDFQVGYTVDAQAASRLWGHLKGVRFGVGVNNVFNRFGPYAPKSQPAGSNNSNVDVATYSPVGRLLFATASVKF
jgi:iron complex outermembrane recepter protein